MSHSPLPRLTDTQLVTLSRAAQSSDARIALPDHLRGSAAVRVIQSLLLHGLIREVEMPASIGLAERSSSPCYTITARGLEAIGVEQVDGPVESEDTKIEDATLRSKEKALPAPASRQRATTSRPPKRERTHSKQAEVLALMNGEAGASIEAIMTATGWQAHTIRAVISGFRKRGLSVARTHDQTGVSRYRIAQGSGPDGCAVLKAAETA